ncbi:hypothetical protein [Streptomyces sp. NPDC002644]
MPAAASTTRPKARSTQSTAKRPVPLDRPYVPVQKRPLPPGRPREWYVDHNRRLKAMRLAIALLDLGFHTPRQAPDEVVHLAAQLIGVHPPSPATCRLVRALLQAH